MSHEITGQKFYSARGPAWHRIGLHDQGMNSAAEAFRRIGQYAVEKRPMIMIDYPEVETGIMALYRLPELNSEGIVTSPGKIIGTATEDYNLITPWEVVNLWDERVGAPVETMGVLRDGSAMFITTKLPSFEVRKEQVDDYLIAKNPMDGKTAATIQQAPVCVVCANTWKLADQLATDSFRIVHDSQAKIRMGDWMQFTYERAAAQVEALKEAADILAKHYPTKPQIQYVLDQTYPIRREPVNNATEDVMALRRDRWERKVDAAEARRTEVLELWTGAGLGMELESRRGTTWGLFQGVVELGDYRTGRNPQSIAESTLFGKRADEKTRAYQACMEVATGRVN